jgi:hypothetical protein
MSGAAVAMPRASPTSLKGVAAVAAPKCRSRLASRFAAAKAIATYA